MEPDAGALLYLYLDGASAALEAGAIVRFLEQQGASVSLEGEVFPEDSAQVLAPGLAAARVADVRDGSTVDSPFPGEIDYERDRIRLRRRSTGVPYEAHRLQECCREALPAGRRGLGARVVVITGRLMGTLDPADGRFHLRTGLFGYPAVLSTAGAVEAPARPREFYVLRAMKADPALAREAFENAFLQHDDPRLTEVMKGYAAQALFFFLSGDPFCPDPGCRLYNAHWQSELLRSQLGPGAGLCPAHRERLASFRAGRGMMAAAGASGETP